MKIGFIGTGVMGHPMARNLLFAGHEVTVFNRTQSKTDDLVSEGAFLAKTPAECAEGKDAVITMLTGPGAVEETVFGRNGVYEALTEDTVYVDMSTVSIEHVRRMIDRLEGAGKKFLQAPVLGSLPQAQNGELLVFAGGNPVYVERIKKAFEVVSKKIYPFETHTRAAATKLAMNMMIGNMMIGLSQTMLFAKNAGVDQSVVLDIIENSALASPLYKFKGARIAENNHEPQFYAEHLLKDLGFAQGAAMEENMGMPANAIATELYKIAVNRGYGKEDISAIAKTMEELAFGNR